MKKRYTNRDLMTSVYADDAMGSRRHRFGNSGGSDMMGMQSVATKRHNIQPNRVDTLSGTVLLVEDEPLVRRMMSRMLQRLGLKVVQAADGLEAIELYKQVGAEISIVLMDWNMPRLSGPDTLKGLRNESKDVPVLILSGQALSGALAQVVDQVQGFLPKPFPRTGLEDTLREFLA